MEKEIALACDLCAAIQEIGRVHEVATQLHALHLRLNHYAVNFKAAEHDSSSCKSSQEVAGEKVQEILKLNSSTLSRLQSIVNGCCCCSNSSGEHKRKKRLETATDSQKIRRRKEETWSAVTTEPYHDGHQWRKYGKKTINNAKYQRSYYRCIHKEEGCLAKKTIQQIEEDGIDDGETTAACRFSVEYICRHTCKLSTAADEVLLEPFVMESTAPISSYSRISTAAGSSGSNSTACCSSSSKLEDDAFVASLLIDQMETVGEDGHEMEDYRKVFSPIYEGCGWDWEFTDDCIPLGNEYCIW